MKSHLGPVVICAALVLGFSGAEEACKGPVQPASVIADDIKVDTTAACTTVTAIDQNTAVSLACLTAEEAAGLADTITHQVSAAVADAGAPKCVAAQGQTLCATPHQMVSAIRVVSARRVDGGKQP
jgi:hypothetical protein